MRYTIAGLAGWLGWVIPFLIAEWRALRSPDRLVLIKRSPTAAARCCRPPPKRSSISAALRQRARGSTHVFSTTAAPGQHPHELRPAGGVTIDIGSSVRGRATSRAKNDGNSFRARGGRHAHVDVMLAATLKVSTASSRGRCATCAPKPFRSRLRSDQRHQHHDGGDRLPQPGHRFASPPGTGARIEHSIDARPSATSSTRSSMRSSTASRC